MQKHARASRRAAATGEAQKKRRRANAVRTNKGQAMHSRGTSHTHTDPIHIRRFSLCAHTQHLSFPLFRSPSRSTPHLQFSTTAAVAPRVRAVPHRPVARRPSGYHLRTSGGCCVGLTPRHLGASCALERLVANAKHAEHRAPNLLSVRAVRHPRSPPSSLSATCSAHAARTQRSTPVLRKKLSRMMGWRANSGFVHSL